MSVQAFYDELAPLYHLVYENWEASVARQGTALASLIGEHWGTGARTVLDAAVGIGTQALGLLALGFQVTGSDLSHAPSIEPGVKLPRVAFRSAVSLPTSALCRSGRQASTSSSSVTTRCRISRPQAPSRQRSANASAAPGRAVAASSQCATTDHRRLPGRLRCDRTASAPGRGAAIISAKSGAGGDRDMTIRSRSRLWTALTTTPPS